ncbi:MAG TPA: hypothetical protein VMV69_06220 [Pirellulales bacterium]|nr:hypothetical protein [Pirellulales bacterium]
MNSLPPIEQAKALRTSLRETIVKTNGLIRALKKQQKQAKVVAWTLPSCWFPLPRDHLEHNRRSRVPWKRGDSASLPATARINATSNPPKNEDPKKRGAQRSAGG